MTEAEAKQKALETVPLPRQIAAAKRELGYRRGVYPKWVASRRMTEAEAAAGTWDMLAVVATLEAVQAERAGVTIPVQASLL